MKRNIKKFIKIFTLIFIVSNILSLGVNASNLTSKSVDPKTIRIGGSDRVATSTKVSQEAFKDKAETVILVGSRGEIDALGGTLLASKVDAPIIMTNKNRLSEAARTEIERLDPNNIIILGGNNVVSQEVSDSLNKYNVERIKGGNREETAISIAKEAIGEKTEEAFIALGYGVYADALAIGPVTADLNKPLLLTSKNGLADETIKALQDFGVKKVTIVGGKSAVPTSIENKLNSIGIETGRVEGSNREKTSINIAKKYFDNPEGIIVANGYVFADSVVGGYYSKKINAPIILSEPNNVKDIIFEYIKETRKDTTILGKSGAISRSVETQLNRALKGEDLDKPEEPEKPGDPKEITVDQVPYDINILEPDSIGTIYMEATYTNNTQYPITSIMMKTLRKDTNETGYLSNHDTVLPGQTSPKFDGFGPDTMKDEDYEILEISFSLEVGNGKEFNIEYNTRLKEYDYYEYPSDMEDAGDITIDQVPYDINILEPDSIGTVYMEATYTNNTQYPITSIMMKTLRKDTNKTGYLSNHDTVMPGQTSPKFDGFGPQTMKDEDYEILQVDVTMKKPNGKKLNMEYDTRLEKYEYNEY